MLYQPSFPSPYLSTIDAKEENIFRFKVNGDLVSAYQILIYNASTNDLVYETEKYTLDKDEYIYGNDGDDSFIEVTIPATQKDENDKDVPILTNGLDYVWKAKLWQPNHDIEVVKGRIYEDVKKSTDGSVGSIKIRPHIEDTVKKGMIIRIGSHDYTINSCILQYPKIYAKNDSNGNSIEVDSSAHGVEFLQAKFQADKNTYVLLTEKEEYYGINIKTKKINEIRTDDNNTTTISFAGGEDVKLKAGVSYIQDPTPSLYATVSVTKVKEEVEEDIKTGEEEVEEDIKTGDEYTILSDCVECDVGFYFKARTSPGLTLCNNNVVIEGDSITNDTASINISAQYTQSQGANIKYWNITLKSNGIKSNGIDIDTTGNVYNGKIEYQYHALLPQKYTLSLVIENSDGTVTKRNIGIDVKYNNANALYSPKVKLVHNSAIEVDWADSVNILGKSNFEIDDDTYDEQSIKLKEGQYILWDTVDESNKLTMPEPTLVKTLVTNLEDYDGTILEIFESDGTDKICVGYDSKVFWWTVNGERFEYNPYYPEYINQVGVNQGDIGVSEEGINETNTLYMWDSSSNNTWKSSKDYKWHYNDAGSLYWWLIQINLYETDHEKMVTFTKYKKE